jgi:translation elongation factor EF-G
MLERMRERYGVEVETRPPRIAYRETIAAHAEGHHRHKKQTGGAGQFGEVFLRIEPLDRGAGFEFVDAIKGGVIPGQFLPAIEKGVRQAMERGVVAGYPLQDLRVTVYDGKYHSVDSKEVAFISAGKKAFLDAVAKAHPVLLEPIVNVEVAIPEHHVGDVTGSLAGKRAHPGHRHATRRRAGDQGAGTAGRTGRLPHRAEIHDRRPRPLQPRPQPLRGRPRHRAETARRSLETARGGGLKAAAAATATAWA